MVCEHSLGSLRVIIIQFVLSGIIVLCIVLYVYLSISVSILSLSVCHMVNGHVIRLSQVLSIIFAAAVAAALAIVAVYHYDFIY